MILWLSLESTLTIFNFNQSFVGISFHSFANGQEILAHLIRKIKKIWTPPLISKLSAFWILDILIFGNPPLLLFGRTSKKIKLFLNIKKESFSYQLWCLLAYYLLPPWSSEKVVFEKCLSFSGMWCGVCVSSGFIFTFEVIFYSCQVLSYRKLPQPKMRSSYVLHLHAMSVNFWHIWWTVT